MGKATVECFYQDELISVDQALELRALSKNSDHTPPTFLCVECRNPVRPLRQRLGGGVSAHMQHIKLNPDCSRSPRPQSGAPLEGTPEIAPERVPAGDNFEVEPLPEQVDPRQAYIEGVACIVSVNAYERNAKARSSCLAHHGLKCKACGFDFEETYGSFARGFIHVHHLVPLSEIRAEYSVDPKNDLVPLCPNCHAAIHLGGKLRTVQELQELLENARMNKA